MTTVNQVKEVKKQFECEVAGYVVMHPELTFDQIAAAFGVSRRSVRRIAERHSLPARKPGRKPKRVQL